MKCENCKNREYCEFYSTFCFEIEDEERNEQDNIDENNRS